jgi:hypothetical protein
MIKIKFVEGHRFSGWPGAWCLDCGAPDALEEALANGIDFDEAVLIENTPCPCPGSNKHNPYHIFDSNV